MSSYFIVGHTEQLNIFLYKLKSVAYFDIKFEGTSLQKIVGIMNIIKIGIILAFVTIVRGSAYIKVSEI